MNKMNSLDFCVFTEVLILFKFCFRKFCQIIISDFEFRVIILMVSLYISDLHNLPKKGENLIL